MTDYIHRDPEFNDLLSIVANEKKINVALIEKDYWIMHVLYSLQQQNIEFELKGSGLLTDSLRTLIFILKQILDCQQKVRPINQRLEMPVSRSMIFWYPN
jgi:hypothetical protein